MMDIIKSKKSKELDRVLATQKDSKQTFVDTTQRVNGYLRSQIEKLHEEKSRP